MCPLSVIPSRMAARIRSSVVSDASAQGRKMRLGLQEGIDLFDELREDVEERGIERLVELRIFAADGLRGVQPAHQFVNALVAGDAADLAAESVDLLDVMDGKVDIVAT